MTIILGIDPGSRMTGLGVLKKNNKGLAYLYCGTVKTPDAPMPIKLRSIFDGVSECIRAHKPDVVSIESVFMHKNPQSAIKLGQARGAAIVAATIHDAEVFEYSPREIKQAVVGYGGATKEQVQHMVRQLLSLAKVPQSDAADALAVAVCHAHSHTRLMSIIKEHS
jgi:crossover junction endodeoxyribonuclease RuvC